MMHRFLASFGIAATLVSLVPVSFAQTGDDAGSQENISAAASQISALITAPEDGHVGRPILLDASASHVVGTDIRYLWYVNESSTPISTTVDALYTPERTGTLKFRLIIRTVVDGRPQESEAAQDIVIYSRKMVIVSDESVPPERVDGHIRAASGAGVYVKSLRFVDSTLSLTAEDAFTEFLSNRSSSFYGAEAIILWSDSVNSLQSLMRAIQDKEGQLREMQKQTIMYVTSRRLKTIEQTARAPFSVLKPQQMILMHREGLNPLLSTDSVEEFLQEARQRDLDMVVLDAKSFNVVPWRALSELVNYMLVRGMSTQTVLLLLMLPVIATILSFLKQVVGLTTFGLFAPSIVALSFVALGWWVGLLFFLFIVIAGYLSHALMHRLHILYIPKMAIIISIVSMTLLVLLAINATFGIVISRDTVFVLLIMSTLGESFLTAKSEGGLVSAIFGISQTIIAALLCVFFVQLPSFQVLILAYPELLLLTIVINIFIGRWTGLRITEYFRFREVFKHMQE